MELIVWALQIYVLLGLLFSIVFLFTGISRIDPAAKGSKLGFRLIILPGLLAFWPLFLIRWIRGLSEPPEENTAHKVAARS